MDQPDGEIDHESVALLAAADQQSAEEADRARKLVEIDEYLASDEGQANLAKFRAAVEALNKPPNKIATFGNTAIEFAVRERKAIMFIAGGFIAGTIFNSHRNRWDKKP